MRFTSTLARASTRRPRLVLLLWLAAAVAAIGAIFLVHVQMSTKVGASGSESSRAENLTREHFPSGDTHEAVILRSRSSTVASAPFQQELGSVRSGLRSVGARLVPQTPPSSDAYAAIVLFELGRAKVGDVLPVVQRLDGKHGFDVAAFGPHFLDHDFHSAAASDLRTGETYGVIAALILLLLVFGALVAALVPLALGLVATLVGLALVTLLGEAFELSVFVRNIVAGMGLALGIDYTLFVLSRFREERARGLEVPDAIEATGGTASGAVVVSGTVVAVALSSMLLVSDRVLRSLALGAAIVTIVAVFAALTLLPALLRVLGDGVNRLGVPVLGRRVAAARPARFWSVVAERVTARPGPWLLVTSGVLVALATPALGLKLGSAGANALPDRLPAKRAFELFQQAFRSATADPTRVVITGSSSSAGVQNAVDRLEQKLQGDRIFFGPPRIERAPGLTAVSFYVAGDPGGERETSGVQRLRHDYIPAARFPASSDVLVGGPTADSLDYVRSIKGSALPVFAFVLGLSFLLLMLAFRSIVVPLKAIVLNLLSVGAAYGVLVLVFEHGFARGLLGLHRAVTIEAWVPMLLFALLFGLSMDYHVFLLSRIREQYRAQRDTTEAVSFGIISTARIVTGAALIIVVVFAGLARGDLVMFQELGLGVAVALLLDATVVRVVLVPSAMRLLGRWNWYPSQLSRAGEEAAEPARPLEEQPTVAITRR
jgi:uncharacterized membrane protein YdfJ with MMPL/SSD domain